MLALLVAFGGRVEVEGFIAGIDEFGVADNFTTEERVERFDEVVPVVAALDVAPCCG